MDSRDDALAARCPLSRGYVPNNGRKYTKELEYLPESSD